MKTFVKVILGLFIIGILALLYLMSIQTLSNKEVMLISIILAILSIFTTWLASHYYSISTYESAVKQVEEDHQSKLKTYALKAAEKVNNLSSELNKLSIYLQDELESEYENLTQQNYSREERIKSAIHIIGTLKSVNDTSLSDWKGVIGEELEEQEEEKKEREDALYEIVDRYEKIISDMKEGNIHNPEYLIQSDLQNEINHLKRDLNILISNIGGVAPIRSKTPIMRKQDVSVKCPICGSLNSYKQKPKMNSAKIVYCSGCKEKLLSRWSSDNNFYLEKEKILVENIECPLCKNNTEIKLSSFPNTYNNIICSNCSNSLRITRRINDILVKSQGVLPKPKEIEFDPNDIELLERVKNKLPEQPWPTGIHKVIAEELNISTSLVHLAINELIKRGDVYFQFNGKIFSEIKK